MAKKTTPNVGITQLNKEIELSNLKLKLPEPVPLPERIDGLSDFVATESKEQRVKPIRELSSQVRKTMRAIKKLQF